MRHGVAFGCQHIQHEQRNPIILHGSSRVHDTWYSATKSHALASHHTLISVGYAAPKHAHACPLFTRIGVHGALVA